MLFSFRVPGTLPQATVNSRLQRGVLAAFNDGHGNATELMYHASVDRLIRKNRCGMDQQRVRSGMQVDIESVCE